MTSATNTSLQRLESGKARHLGRLGGEMTVLSGRIWLTRDGASGDHFLDAGETVRIAVDEYAVIESALANTAATLRWTPRRQTVAGRILAEPLVGLAFVTGAVADALTWVSQRVAAAARSAQGNIDAPVELLCEQRR